MSQPHRGWTCCSPFGWLFAAAFAALALFLPGLALGMLVAGLYWRQRKTPFRWRLGTAALLLLPSFLGAYLIAPVAPPSIFGLYLAWIRHSPSPRSLAIGVLAEVCWGPLWLIISAALLGRLPQAQPSPVAGSPAHPPGRVRLGWNYWASQWLDLDPAVDFARHITLLGTTGSGKTFTIGRLTEGVLALGWAVLIIDAKGGSLRSAAYHLARTGGVDYRELVPGQGSHLQYNPCELGSAAQVANKLVGAFSFGPEAQIYQNVATETLSILVEALRLHDNVAAYAATRQLIEAARAAGETLDEARYQRITEEAYAQVGVVSIARLRDHLEPAAMRRLAQALGTALPPELEIVRERNQANPEPDPWWVNHQQYLETGAAVIKELMGLAERGAPAPSAYAGMRARLGALLHGEFGQIFGTGPELKLEHGFSQPGLTYISLPAMASNEDVRLMARVLIQDLKLIAHRRLTAGSGAPALLVLDEFAALDDPEQITDLLRQAREARVRVVVSSQHLPELANLQKALLGVGLVIAHQCATSDAQAVADLIGTYTTTAITRQIGGSGAGSERDVERYVIHPNTLRSLPPGRAALRLIDTRGSSATLVQVLAANAFLPQDEYFLEPNTAPAGLGHGY